MQKNKRTRMITDQAKARPVFCQSCESSLLISRIVKIMGKKLTFDWCTHLWKVWYCKKSSINWFNFFQLVLLHLKLCRQTCRLYDIEQYTSFRVVYDYIYWSYIYVIKMVNLVANLVTTYMSCSARHESLSSVNNFLHLKEKIIFKPLWME